jgi:hypothetical protein
MLWVDRYRVAAGPEVLLTEATWYIDADQHDGNTSVENLGTGGTVTGTENGVTFLAYDGAPSFYVKDASSHVRSASDIDVDSLDIAVRVRLPDWTPAAIVPFVAKFAEAAGTDSNRNFYFRVLTTGELSLGIRTAGANVFSTSTAATGFADGSRNWVRVTRDRSSGDVKFWTGADGDAIPTWTQLGTTVAGSTAAITVSSSSTYIGSLDGTTTHAIGARFYDAIIRDAATSGTIVGRMNASDAPEATSWVDAVGVTWEQTALGQRSILVDRNLWSFDGVNDYIEWADNAVLDLGAGQDCTWFVAARLYVGGANRVVLSKINATPTGFNLYLSSGSVTRFNFSPGAADEASGPNVTVAAPVAVLAGTVDLAAADENRCYHNGTLGTANAVTDASIANASVMRMGCTTAGALFAPADVVAAARFDRVLDEDELDLLNDYFQTR